MFENVISQPAAVLLMDDIRGSRLPPSILFSGPSSSGKLTAALELARSLSCKNADAPWQCECPSCLRHKELVHPDLLIIGSRNCYLEIQASAEAFLRSQTQASRYLFIRAVRKLTLRFHPVLQEGDESRFSKAAPLLADIEEALEEFSPRRPIESDSEALKKKVESLKNLAGKLEDDFLPDSIPVSQVRNASSWVRLSPAGKRKILIVENADRMQESARNAFLKVLEEPPENVAFILTTNRRGAILPTILSRVRTYAFVERSIASQHEVISRVFRDVPQEGSTLDAYFNRFLPVSPEQISAAASAFLNGILLDALDEGRRPLPALKESLRSDSAPRMDSDSGAPASILVILNRCKPSIVWTLFLSRIARYMRDALRNDSADAREISCFSRWTVLLRDASDSVNVYNIGAQAAIEKLREEMKAAL